MGKDTTIEWAHHTFNPWWGCTKVSAGCHHCYAESWDARFGGDHWGPGKPRRLASEKYWAEPHKWNAAAEREGCKQRVFCASMADVFDAEAPAEALDRLFELIRATPWLDWLLLTKRPERIRSSLPADWGGGYKNVWLGVTVEDQGAANTRIPLLVEVPAAVRFLSIEPLIGPIDNLQLDRIDWVIVGGESGPRVRAMQPSWVRSLHDTCSTAGVAFFFKQWGTLGPDESGNLIRLGKKRSGRQLDGRTWDELPAPRALLSGKSGT